ncbi:hypothetical protein BH11ARM2_BH11ARM2_05190 [soil metagenome]
MIYPWQHAKDTPKETPTPAAESLKNVCNLFLKDLEALPEEAYDKKFGPKVRTITDIVYEVNLVNDSIVRDLLREPNSPFPTGGWLTAPEGSGGKEKVIEAFKASSEKAVATVETFSPEQMEEKVKTEEGESTRTEQVRFMSIHLWYHLGQINYVQTLLGDDVWHWN